VDLCAATLAKRGVTIVSPPTDQPFGHRTLFFRDPDGNVLEISPRSIRHDEGMAYRVLGRLSGKDRPEHIIARDPRITHLSAFAGRHFAGRA
jgi:hypothetical protein